MKKIYFAAGITLLALAVTGFFFVQWANKPATSQGSKTSGTVLSSAINLTGLDTKYFSTSIPDYYLVKNQLENKQNNTLARYLLTSKDANQSDQVGIILGSMGDDNSIDAISAVKLRSTYPDLYKRIELPFVPDRGVAFSKISDYEKMAVWHRQNTYVAITVSGSNQRESELDQTLQAILANWRWVDVQ